MKKIISVDLPDLGGRLTIKLPSIRSLILTACTFVLLLILFFPSFLAYHRASDHVELALNAIVENDTETWQSLFHPTCAEEFSDLKAFKEELRGREIVILRSFSTDEIDGEPFFLRNKNNIVIKTVVQCGTRKYLLTVIYCDNSEGRGLIYFDITSYGTGGTDFNHVEPPAFSGNSYW